jgi:hypothetical protein
MADEHRVPKPYQEWDMGSACLIGRDPRRMTPEELRTRGIGSRRGRVVAEPSTPYSSSLLTPWMTRE